MSNRKVTTKTIRVLKELSATMTGKDISKILNYKPATMYDVAYRYGIKFTSSKCRHSTETIQRITLLREEQKLKFREISEVTGLTTNVCIYLYGRRNKCDRHPSSTTQ